MKHDRVTIAHFDNQAQMHILKSRLEHEGIECYVQNEHASVYLGGGPSSISVRLQVQRDKVLKAHFIMQKAGYPIDRQAHTPAWVHYLSRWADRIPLVKNLSQEKKWFLIALVLVSAFVLSLALFLNT